MTIDFPADFPVSELAGKQASYGVALEMKEKVLPALDDNFAAKLLPGKTPPECAR